MSYTCWKCPEQLETQRQLKAHGTSRHQWMRVTCPWCYEETREYKRPAELKDHSKKHHKGELENLPQEFFSENNGFVLSINPIEYRKIVKPSRWESVEAEQARSAVLKWVQAAKNPPRSQKDIEKGWEPENDSDSIYSDISIGSLNEKSENSEAEDMESEEAEYCPDTPEISAPELECVTLVPGEAMAEYSCHLDYYRVEIKDSIYKDIRGMASLARRMETLKQNTAEMGQGTTYKLNGNSLKEQLQIATRILGVDGQHINTVKRIERDLFLTRQTVDGEKENKRPTPLKELKNNHINLPTATTNTYHAESLKESQPKPKPKQPSQVLSSSDTHFDKPPLKTQSRVILTLQQRARKILEYGCLPLIPSARRNWDREEILKLEGTSITWPPRGWRKMKSDQKKLCWEFAATSLESRTQPFTNINRTDLLDKYNCLALPGTSEDGSHTDSKVKSKARYYNYEYLRTIANSKSYSEEDWDFVEMCEKCTTIRNKSVDSLIAQINRYRVLLRLDDQ